MTTAPRAAWGARVALLVLALLGGVAAIALWPRALRRGASPEPGAELHAVSPRHLSNQTSYPVIVYGERLREGLRLELSGPFGSQTVPTTLVDARHLTASIPAGLAIPEQIAVARVHARLLGVDGGAIAGSADLEVVNDQGYPQPYDFVLSPDETRAFVVSPSTDEVWVQSAGAPGRRVRVGDRPIAVAHYRDRAGHDWLVVAHEYEDALLLLRMDAFDTRRSIPVPREAQGLAVDGRAARAYVTNRRTDSVYVVDLEAGRVTATIPVGVNPRAVAVGAGASLCVSNLGSNDLSLVSLGDGSERRVAARRGTPILGGHTSAHSDHVMGGKSIRALAFSESLNLYFAATIGPNVGPNPQRMEVSMNGGVSVVDPARARVVRHVSMLGGVPEGLALDPARSLLYVADIGLGRLVAFDARLLAHEREAGDAMLAAVEIAPPREMPLLRDAGDFGVKGRAGVALHSGPRVVRLSSDGQTAFVLSRFLGTVTVIDVSHVREGRLEVKATWQSHVHLRQQLRRRLGEVAYFTDLGNTRMTCDTCHYEGHDDGVLFTKGKPMHIYRAPSLRSVSETAPYFTPALLPSLEFTARFVLGRNRFHNPDPNRLEVSALTLYQATFVVPPNPNRRRDGSFPAEIALPDGRHGSPVRGMALFEGKAGCVSCHPPPQFTTDQSPETRRRLYDVGTPITLDLHREWQDAERYPLPAPALVGVWDNFPLLHSGAAGYVVSADGHVDATRPFALGEVLELAAESGEHGEVGALAANERADLLAFLLGI